MAWAWMVVGSLSSQGNESRRRRLAGHEPCSVVVERVLLASAPEQCATRVDAKLAIAHGRVQLRERRSGAVHRIDAAREAPKINLQTSDLLLDGNRVHMPRRALYLLVNKPRNMVTTMGCDLHPFKARKQLSDLIREKLSELQRGDSLVEQTFGHRWFPVGRLDAETSGLLLITNDGFLSHAMTQPNFQCSKSYIAWVVSNRFPKFRDPIQQAALDTIQKGVTLGCGRVACAESIRIVPFSSALRFLGAGHEHFFEELDYNPRHDGYLLELKLTQGLNRQVRRMLRAVGYRVERLSRTSIGCGVTAPNLAPGEARYLQEHEIEDLYQNALQHAGPLDVVYDFEKGLFRRAQTLT